MSYTKVILICVFLVLVVILAFPILQRGPRERGKSAVNIEMRSLAHALQYYEAEYDKYPSGSSSDILSALLGNNPNNKPYLGISSRSTNNLGQFIDPWGTPYEIRFDSTNPLTIRSAGKNKIFGDKDDLTMSIRSIRR